MADFINQFTVIDPFRLPKRPEFFSWPYQIATEAAELLDGKSRGWLKAVASQIERVIAAEAKNPTVLETGFKQTLARKVMKIMHFEHFSRETYGDVHLFNLCESTHDWSSESVQSTRVQRFAVLALWKIVDAYIALDDTPSQDSDFSLATQEIRRWNLAGGHAIEGMRALQTARTISMEAKSIADRNRENGILANPNAQANRLRALEMAEEMPFRSMSKAADHIASNLVKGTTKTGKEVFYSTEWIKRWLRESGWTPQHKRKAPQ